MRLMSVCFRGLLAGAMVLCSTPAFAQEYPNKPIRIVTAEPGGGTDFMARLFAQGLSRPLGQNVIVENRGSALTGEIVARAPADGYTLLFTNEILWIVPLLQKTPYDPIRDFSPVTFLASAPNLLTVHPSVPVNSVKEFIALAKAKPGELNYASSATGTSAHTAAELFKAMAGVNIVRIPYKGGGPALTALIGGQVQLLFPTTGGAAPHIKSGTLRALAVASAHPSPLAPGLPTVAEAGGLPGYESILPYVFFVPAKSPAKAIVRLHAELIRALNAPEMKEKLHNAGIEPVGSTPEQLATKVKANMATMGKLIRDAGIRAD